MLWGTFRLSPSFEVEVIHHGGTETRRKALDNFTAEEAEDGNVPSLHSSSHEIW